MAESEKLISAIVPVYNSEKDLRRCLDSLINQTYQNLEIILIDDGSIDSSGAICDEYAAKDNRIVCVHQPNGGVSKARNRGLSMAHGDYVNFPDSDDYLDVDAYEYLMARMEEHDCDAVNFETFVTYPDHETAHKLPEKYYGLFDTEGAHAVMLAGEPFCCNKLYARHLVDGLQFREDIFRGEDSLFAHFALDRAEKVWFDERPLYHYVQSEESACRGVFRPSQLSAVRLYDAYKPLYQKKYPALYQQFLVNMSDLLISLYYDMWADEKNYDIEQKNLVKEYRHRLKEIDFKQIGSSKQIKLRLFCFSPKLFALTHKTVHKL